jgi:thiamine-monophosphate kinase
MIDISDGLASDLGHVCEESRCGYELYAERIPVPHEVSAYCKIHSLDPLKYALGSGEEYQLIFTSKQKIEDKKIASLIGKIIPDGKYITINNSTVPVTGPGFDHFKR